MFVGYADDHTGDVYRFSHLKIQQQRCKMDEHHVESIHEKTTTHQP